MLGTAGFGGGIDENGGEQNQSLMRLLADVQALIAAQRRIEWKLTGLSKAQLAVNGSLAEVKQDVSQIRSALTGEPMPPPGDPQTPGTVTKTQSRTATAIRNLARSKSMGAASKPREPPQESPLAASPLMGGDGSPANRQRPRALDTLEGEETPARQGPMTTPRTLALSPIAHGKDVVQEEVLRLRKHAGHEARYLCLLGRWKRTFTSAYHTTDCRYPAIECEEHEAKGDALDRLIDFRLHPIRDGIELSPAGTEETTSVRESKSSFFSSMRGTKSVTVRSTIFDGIMVPQFDVAARSIVLPAGSFSGSKKGVSIPMQDVIGCWDDNTVYLYSWLTHQEQQLFASADGDALLGRWIQAVKVDEDLLKAERGPALRSL
eukprot:TRINITY_DN48332_c0_g1_i1.p1 TRINITY_DN48332_c0_g1~~TRINITY_DN48332_c0_g1_i1.p1  ORF type:complete len:377 (+),score=67.34 TRINITY_DN48332_c0_g1_i1:133-1263(+)